MNHTLLQIYYALLTSLFRGMFSRQKEKLERKAGKEKITLVEEARRKRKSTEESCDTGMTLFLREAKLIALVMFEYLGTANPGLKKNSQGDFSDSYV